MYIWLILYVGTMLRSWPWKDADRKQNVASEYKPDKQLHSKSGTLSYLAPEVYAGTGYLTEVDWWSLGVTFYECIYNKVSLPLTGSVGCLTDHSDLSLRMVTKSWKRKS